jgi:predicted RecA/RadA family phage recombinase
MAQNYVQRGHSIDIAASPVTAPGGSGIQYGALLFGVSVSDAVVGGPVTLCLTGIWTLPTPAVTFNIGDAVYWDNTATLATNVATGGNLPIGIATDVSIGPGEVNVRLHLG